MAAVPRRLTVRFEGQVQGVGFRFTAVEIARGFPVHGYVQNLMEGDVRLVAEGLEADLLAYLTALRSSHVYRYVRQEHLNWSSALGEFTGFDIRYA